MKHLMKTLIGTSAMMLVFGSCSSIPGAQEWKIKKVTSDSGNTYKTLYLLLSKDCDSLYYASDENDTEQKLRNEVSEKSLFNIK